MNRKSAFLNKKCRYANGDDFMINDSGIFLLKNKEPFDRQELFRVLEEQYKGLSLASYKLKMQRLLESGEIARVGRNYERHPFLEYRIFELVQMNEFLNHQIAHNAVFVFVEADLGDFVFETLKEKYPGKVLLNPSVKEYHLYWQDDLIIVGKLLTEAPKGKKAVWHTCLEKMLVDMTAEKVIKTTFSEAEYPGILEQAFQKYIIDESQMFRYAKRRHVKDDILKIIQNQTGIKLRTEK